MDGAITEDHKQMNDRNKVMDRIRKLLAMAQDVSSPHEAAIAAGRARKLMDQHQVSELELTSSEPDRFESENFKTGNKTTDKFSGICGLAVAKLNDCVVSWKRDGNGYPYLKFDGMLGDAVCAIARSFLILSITLLRSFICL